MEGGGSKGCKEGEAVRKERDVAMRGKGEEAMLKESRGGETGRGRIERAEAGNSISSGHKSNCCTTKLTLK